MSTVCVDWSGRRAAFHISTHHRRIHHQRSDMAASAMTSTFVGTNVHAKARVSHAKAGRRAALTTRCGAYDEELVATAVRARRMRSKKRNAKRYACQQPSTKRRDEERAMHPRWSVAATTATEKKKKTPPTKTIQKKKGGGRTTSPPFVPCQGQCTCRYGRMDFSKPSSRNVNERKQSNRSIVCFVRSSPVQERVVENNG